YLGSFSGEDRVLVLYSDGTYDLTSFDLSNHYQGDILWIGRRREDSVISAIHYDGERGEHYLKRFLVEDTRQGNRVSFISDSPGSKLEFASADTKPRVEVHFRKQKDKQPEPEQLDIAPLIEIKGIKAL